MQTKLSSRLQLFLVALFTFLVLPLTSSAQFNDINIGGNAIGSVTDNGGGSYTIVGGGNDIWDARDEFTFAYEEVAGDFDVRVRVESLEFNANWSKAGIMARETLAEDSRMAFARVTPTGGANDTFLAYRSGLPGVSGDNSGQHEDRDAANTIPNPPYPNAWLRLVREGAILTAYNGIDGSDWELVASQDTTTWQGGVMPTRLLVGLAVSRHQSGGPSATAEMRDYSVDRGAFSMAEASSRGIPDKIYVNFSQPPVGGATDPLSYDVPGVDVLSAEVGADANTILLTTAAALTEGTAYTVNLFGVTDGGGNPPANGSFTFTHGEGYEARAIHVTYNQIPGGANDQMLASTAYNLNIPTGVWGQPAILGNTLFEDPIVDDGVNERFSSKIFGLVQPDVTGDYVFALSSDDNSKLYLSTDSNPANKVLLANEPVWNGSRQYATLDRRNAADPENISDPVALVAGETYYLELLIGEGGGGNNGSVTWQKPGEAAPANDDLPIEEVNFAPSRFHNGNQGGTLFSTLGAVQIVQQPASITGLFEGATAAFGVQVDGTPAYHYQWYQDGSTIPGATGKTLSFATVAADDGSTFSVEVSNAISTEMSSAASLSLIIDNEAPTLVSATPGVNSVVIEFSEPVNTADASDPFNYTIAGLSVISATMVSDSAVSLTTSEQTGGVEYTVEVSGIRDLAFNANVIAGGSSVSFTSIFISPGFVKREIWTDLAGTAIADLRNSPDFPDNPNETLFIKSIDGPSAFADNYGIKISGYLLPRTTANYDFYVSADDSAEFWLSTDANPSNIQLLAREPVWNNARQWLITDRRDATNPENRSTTLFPEGIALNSGEAYYFEALMKEGSGGDNLGVLAIENGNLPNNGDPPIDSSFLLGVVADPATAGEVEITSQPPSSLAVDENAIVSLSVEANSSTGDEIVILWTRNGEIVATGATYTFQALVADDGAVYQASVNILGKQILSDQTSLAVVEDVNPPQVVSVTGSSTFNLITIQFNEPMESTTASDPFNYLLSGGLSVLGASLSADGTTVTLATSPQTPGATYSLELSGLIDLQDNEIASGTTVDVNAFVISQGFVNYRVFNDIPGVAVGDLTGNSKYPNNPDILGTTTSFNSPVAGDNFGIEMTALFVPAVSGNHIFYLRSDDASQLWFNPTGPDPAGASLLLEETGCCGPFSRFISTPQNLVAGEGYFIQLLGKEGGGGEFFQVAFQLEEGAANPDSLMPIPGGYLAGAFDPNATGEVTITQQPGALTVDENAVVTLTVGAESPTGDPIFIKWQRDGVDIGGAFGASYSFIATVADDTADYRAVVSIPGLSVTSDVADLTVIEDLTPPSIVGGLGSADFLSFTIQYSEFVEEVTATDPFNYAILEGGVPSSVTVSEASLNPDGQSVILVTSMQAENTTYTVEATGMTDLSDNIADTLTVDIQSWVSGGGGLEVRIFNGIGGAGPISLLYDDPRYPNSPDEVYTIGRFDSREFYPDDSHDNYGASVRGIFIPNRTGNWKFWLRSDDNSQLLFNPDGLDPSGAQLILEELGCCNGFGTYQSVFFPLVAGQGYYIEGNYKEGGGNDFIQVAATLEGDPPPTEPGDLISPAASAIGGNLLGFPAAPPGIAGNVTIVTQPADTEVIENQIASFSVEATNDNNLSQSYQWQLNGADIAGETGPTLNLLVTRSDDGAQVTVKVGIIGASTVTAPATLSVIADVFPPNMVSARANINPLIVTIVYDEGVEEFSSTDPFNYEVKPVGGSAIVVNTVAADAGDPLGRTFVLTLDTGLQLDTAYEVTAFGIADLAIPANIQGSTTVTFNSFTTTRGFVRRDFWNNFGGVTVPDLTNDPRYPNNPDETDYNTLLEGITNARDNYGIRLSGFIVPQETDLYDFFLSADDGAAFWLSTDNDPANLVLVASEPIWNDPRQWLVTSRRDAAAPENRSTTLFPDGIQLVAGQRYAYEALMKEGGGGDNVGVTWIKHGGDLPPNGSEPINGAFLETIADPEGTAISITAQPADITVGVGCNVDDAGFYLEDFSSGDGGYTVINTGALESEWVYNAGSGTWSVDGSDNVGSPTDSRLVSPLITVPEDGPLFVSFNHRYSFESGDWDGGHVQVRKTGAVSEDFYSIDSVQASTAASDLWPASNLIQGPGVGYASAPPHTKLISGAAGNWVTDAPGGFPSDYIAVAGAPVITLDLGSDQDLDEVSFWGYESSNANGATAATLRFASEADGPGGFGTSIAFNPSFNDLSNADSNARQSRPLGQTVTARYVEVTITDNAFLPPGDGSAGETPGGDRAGLGEIAFAFQNVAVGPFVSVQAGDFLENGYNSNPLIGNHALTGQIAYNGNSAGYGAGDMIRSVAFLGDFQAGDQVQVAFLGAWDEFAKGSEPNWEVGSVELFQGAPPVETGFAVAATGTINDGQPSAIFYQWQRSDDGGASWADIPGANGSSLAVDASLADSGSLLRAGISVPGLTAFSDGALLTVSTAPTVAITSPPDGFVGFAGIDATITADASDTDGTVVQVEFFAEGLGSLGVDTDGSDGWSVTILDPPPGIFILSAVATDNIGISCDSLPVTIELLPNQPPVANDDSATTDEDVAVVIDVLANDTDPDGDALTVVIDSSTANGSLTVNPDQTVTYTPNPNYNGGDSFSYHANDGQVDSGTATVTITVLPVNDAPACADGAATTDEDVAATISLTASDIDNATEDLSGSVVSQPGNGSVSISGLVATYTPAANYCGADSFTFKVSDPAGAESGVCTVVITVNAVNDAPSPSIEVGPLSDLGPTVPGLIVISPNNENVCVVLSGSATDIDAENGCGNSDIVSLTWLVDDVEVGTGPVIDACLLVGAREVKLLAEDGEGAIGETTAIVEVLSGCEAVEELIMVVNDSIVERGNKRPFIATLKTACAAFERGSVGSALNRLNNAFMNKVRAQISKDNPDEAAEWNRIAQEIVDAYGRSQDCDCGSDE